MKYCKFDSFMPGFKSSNWYLVFFLVFTRLHFTRILFPMPPLSS